METCFQNDFISAASLHSPPPLPLPPPKKKRKRKRERSHFAAAQNTKCVNCSAAVNPEFPTSNRSKSTNQSINWLISFLCMCVCVWMKNNAQRSRPLPFQPPELANWVIGTTWFMILKRCSHDGPISFLYITSISFKDCIHSRFILTRYAISRTNKQTNSKLVIDNP